MSRNGSGTYMSDGTISTVLGYNYASNTATDRHQQADHRRLSVWLILRTAASRPLAPRCATDRWGCGGLDGVDGEL
jgi:hypothetical protein